MKWADEIANELWGTIDNRRATLSKKEGPIRKLTNKGYIKEELRPPDVTSNRRYYKSTPNWIIDEISSRTEINDNQELNKLLKIFDSEKFRKNIHYRKQYLNSLNSIIDLISDFAIALKFLNDVKSKYDIIGSLEEIKKISKEDLKKIFNLNDLKFAEPMKSSMPISVDFFFLNPTTISKLSKLNLFYEMRSELMWSAFLYGRLSK